jgi:hypothetical protein
MSAKVDVIEKYLVEETLTEEQKNELKEVFSELQEFFPNYESALYALAKLATLTTFRPDAPKDAIDIETRFFEVLFQANNWSKSTKLGLSKFMRPNSRIAKIVEYSISMQASAAKERGIPNRTANDQRKYEEAKKLYTKNLKDFARYTNEVAADSLKENYPEKKFSKRRLQTLIPIWKSEFEKENL